MIFNQTTVTPLRLADDVYQRILVAISEGKLEPGERLFQEKIASEMNVSRTPIREAFLRLEQEGILLKTERKGFTVRRVSAQEVRDVFGAREAVEGYSAFIVAKEKKRDQLAAIKLAFEAEMNEKSDDLKTVFNLNRALHRAVVEQTGNQMLLNMFDAIWNSPAAMRIFAATNTESHKPLLTDHQSLLEQITHSSPEMAQAAAIDHIRNGLELHIDSIN